MLMIDATRRRHDHAQLREHVDHIRLAAREIPTLSPDERSALAARIVDFLRGTLAPHAKEEEWGLYPEIARLLGNPRATATMARDHEAIRERTAELEIADPEDGPRLQELLYGLHALISVHLWKEEVEYLPLLEQSRAGSGVTG
jgi:iron-sulfur cluster repair protein YtfE (RIC family)